MIKVAESLYIFFFFVRDSPYRHYLPKIVSVDRNLLNSINYISITPAAISYRQFHRFDGELYFPLLRYSFSKQTPMKLVGVVFGTKTILNSNNIMETAIVAHGGEISKTTSSAVVDTNYVFAGHSSKAQLSIVVCNAKCSVWLNTCDL